MRHITVYKTRQKNNGRINSHIQLVIWKESVASWYYILKRKKIFPSWSLSIESGLLNICHGLLVLGFHNTYIHTAGLCVQKLKLCSAGALQLTKVMKYGPSWIFIVARQLWSPQVHYPIQNSPTRPNSDLRRSKRYLCTIYFKIRFKFIPHLHSRFTSNIFFLSFSTNVLYLFLSLPCVLRRPMAVLVKAMLWIVEVMKLFIMWISRLLVGWYSSILLIKFWSLKFRGLRTLLSLFLISFLTYICYDLILMYCLLFKNRLL